MRDDLLLLSVCSCSASLILDHVTLFNIVTFADKERHQIDPQPFPLQIMKYVC